MKIKKITPQQVQKAIARIKKNNTRNAVGNNIYTITPNNVYSGRYNLERHAESLTPQKYLAMRNYYSSLEMAEMLNNARY